jgi:hypothetical protein
VMELFRGMRMHNPGCVYAVKCDVVSVKGGKSWRFDSQQVK